MIPGSDLLTQAMGAISFETIGWCKASGRTRNEAGQYVSTFDPPVDVEASVQAVSRARYAFLNLDLNRRYINVFTPNPVVDLRRNITGDQFLLADGTFLQIESSTDWSAIDGWVECLCIAVPFQ